MVIVQHWILLNGFLAVPGGEGSVPLQDKEVRKGSKVDHSNFDNNCNHNSHCGPMMQMMLHLGGG